MIRVPQNFWDIMKALHKDFIWSGKKPLDIRHSTLIGDYCELELKDVDIDATGRIKRFWWTVGALQSFSWTSLITFWL